jgi:hypothetical protein
MKGGNTMDIIILPPELADLLDPQPEPLGPIMNIFVHCQNTEYKEGFIKWYFGNPDG